MGRTPGAAVASRQRQARSAFYRALERSPSLFCRYHGRFEGRHAPTERTDIVVEGYPSAGNSFTREALILTNPGIEVASHLHSVAPLRLAMKRGVPAVALLREPSEAVASYLARFGTSGPGPELRRYSAFMEGLAEVKDYALVVTFEQVTSDFAGMVQQVNRRFAVSFRTFAGSQEQLAAEVDAILVAASRNLFGDEADLRGPIPSERRRPVAAAIRAEIEAPRWAPLLSRARRAYQRSLAWAGAHRGDGPGPVGPWS